jgi:redox-sensing transcriptional repressor
MKKLIQKKLIQRKIKKKNEISDLTIERLIVYSKYLNDLKRAGVTRILSADIAKHFNIDSAQVRKDLSYIGKLGKPGSGYDVEKLYDILCEFLLMNKKMNTVIIGVGNLGSALLGYKIFSKTKINIICGFDINPDLIGQRIHGSKIYALEQLENTVRENNIDVGIITTPADVANDIAVRLQAAGIKGIINFAPVHIVCKKDIEVLNVDLSVFFDTMRYNIFKNIS